MGIKTVGFGPSLEVDWGSDLKAFAWSEGALTITVACEISPEHVVRGLEIRFANASGLRFLDELDLARYWPSDGFVRGFHVFEVLAEGWADEETILQGYDRPRREWLVVTGNGCVNVFAAEPPYVAEASWPLLTDT